MLKLISKIISISCLVAALFALMCPAAHSQQQSMTKVTPVPDGGYFSVDGANYQHAVSFMWPAGSKHTLFAPNITTPMPDVQYVFQNWRWSGGAIQTNPFYATADPAITEYQAVFQVSYGVRIRFNGCDGSAAAGPCTQPGVVTVNGTAITSDQEIYFTAGSNVLMQATPNPGWIFVGWSAGTAQQITGFQNIVTINGPTVISALFTPARPINLATVPPNLSVLMDRTAVPTPNTLDWGMGTVHTVGPVTPQRDTQGRYWVFSSWSDGGAPIHAYTVASSPMPDSLTATFVPGVAVTLQTEPQGLNLNVDGRVNWPTYDFLWGAGETHTIQAPMQQTDSASHVWQFKTWSNGAQQVQTITVPGDDASIASGVRITATYSPMGHVIVTSAIPGVTLQVDGSDCATPCDILRALNQQVTVRAPASIPAGQGSRQDFAGWSNGATGDLVLTFGSDTTTITANYHLMNLLSATASVRGGVSFSMQPVSTDGFYDSQAHVTVNASPQPGFRFRNWTGDLSGSTLSGTVSMDSPRAVEAMVDRVPYVSPAGVQNGAGTTPQAAVAPGSIVSIFGVNLATDVFVGQGSPLVQALGGVTVRLGDRVLPLFFVSPTQINLQMPSDLTPGAQTLVVSAQGMPDVQAAFNIVQDAPGLFPQAVNGQIFAVAVHPDGSPVTPSSPAASGETITVYGTGFGATSPARPDGFALPAAPVYTLQDALSISLSGVALPVVSAFALPGSIGVDAIQFVIGDGVPPSSNAQLTIASGGQASNTVLLPIQ